MFLFVYSKTFRSIFFRMRFPESRRTVLLEYAFLTSLQDRAASRHIFPQIADKGLSRRGGPLRFFKNTFDPLGPLSQDCRRAPVIIPVSLR